MGRCSTIRAAFGAPVYDPSILHSPREFFEQVWIGLEIARNRDIIHPTIQPLINREDVPIVFRH
ncbi:hypothetical protein BV20DRAFT_967333 [Pilatotrama ljubarskyi]|nr:hypothetical protein BV20DRAFT_967333 [Pilatotrama ljubarskyi]